MDTKHSEECVRQKDNVERCTASSSINKGPDGGWGWVVVLGGGIAFSLLTGFNKSVSLFYEELLKRFGQSASETAWVISIAGTLRMVTGPLISALCTRFSHRVVGMASSILMVAAYLSAAFIPSLLYLSCTYSVFHGFGMNMFIVPQVSMVNIYFTKNRGKANAISTCFIGFGAFYMAPLLVYLFSEYGYIGTLILLAGLSLHQIPAAALFRPLRNISSAISVQEKETKPGENPPNEAQPCKTNFSNHEKQRDTQHCVIETENIPLMEVDGKISEEKQTELTISPQKPTLLGSQRTIKAQGIPSLLTKTLQAFTSCLRFFGLGGLKNLNLFTLCLLMASYGIINTNGQALVAGLALEKGFLESEVTLLMSLNAVAEIVFRLSSGILFDLKLVRTRRPLALGILGGLSGIIAAVLPFTPGVVPSMIFWFLTQGFQGGFHTQTTTVMSDLVSRSQITNSLGMLRFVQGIGNLIGPLLGGLSRDLTGSYRYGYVVAGIQFTFMCALFLILNILRQRKVLN